MAQVKEFRESTVYNIRKFMEWIKAGSIIKVTFKFVLLFIAVNILVLNWFFKIHTGFHVISQYEKGIVFRLGKYRGTEGPGLHFIPPLIDNLEVVKVWERVVDIPKQQVVTKDLVTLIVDGVLRYRVVDPKTAIIEIDDFNSATIEMSLTTIKEAVGEIKYERLISRRSETNKKVMEVVSQNAKNWGIEIEGIEIKRVVPIDSDIQESLTKRAIAEQERNARLLMSEAEKEVANNFVEAAAILDEGGDSAMKLRYYHTLEKFSQIKSGNFFLPIDISESK
ncbi:MAG: SPFH domain-containing protein [Cyanobacteria bacterium P01_G01_bin.54]